MVSPHSLCPLPQPGAPPWGPVGAMPYPLLLGDPFLPVSVCLAIPGGNKSGYTLRQKDFGESRQLVSKAGCRKKSRLLSLAGDRRVKGFQVP